MKKLKIRTKLTGFVLFFCTVVTACNMPFTPREPTPVPKAIYTYAVQTVIAELTSKATLATPTQLLVSTPTLTASPLPPSNTPLPTNTAQPTVTPSPTSAPSLPTYKLVFKDDFSSGVGWADEGDESWGFGFMDGGYQIYVNIRHATIWSIRDQEFADVSLEVDAIQTDGPVDGYFGLVCRLLDSDNYYVLAISSNGTSGIAKMDTGEFTWLQEAKAPDGIIKSGGASNHIRADCVGSVLTLSVNGQKILEIQDETFDTGVVGLAVGTRKKEGVQVLFDNFEIRQP